MEFMITAALGEHQTSDIVTFIVMYLLPEIAMNTALVFLVSYSIVCSYLLIMQMLTQK